MRRDLQVDVDRFIFVTFSLLCCDVVVDTLGMRSVEMRSRVRVSGRT